MRQDLARWIEDTNDVAEFLIRHGVEENKAYAAAAGLVQSFHDHAKVIHRVRRQNRELHDLEELDHLY